MVGSRLDLREPELEPGPDLYFKTHTLPYQKPAPLGSGQEPTSSVLFCNPYVQGGGWWWVDGWMDKE